MPSRSWVKSGRPATRDRGTAGRAKPAGSLSVAIVRAREAWDGLTGGPTVDLGPDIPEGRPVMAVDELDELPRRRVYSAFAAAAILDVALRLWPDTAATMGEDPAPED